MTEPQIAKPDGKFMNCVQSKIASGAIRTPISIVFVRNRMLYARAALNTQGGVRFGLRHIRGFFPPPSPVAANVLDVLNRHSYNAKDSNDTNTDDSSASKPHQSTVHVMMYIFPRQFGLHNVFTNDVDHRETVQPFKDYTLREDEINKIYPSPSAIKIPKRLRGKATSLVRKLQILHNQCPYKKLLEYYCPVGTEGSNRLVLY